MNPGQFIGALFFLSLLGYAMGLMLLIPRLKSGHALLCAYCGMLFLSFYGVVLLGGMSIAAHVLLYGGLAFLILGIVALFANWRGLRRRICTAGILFYLFITCVITILSIGAVISDHDSLSYWARVVKELFTFDRFYIHADSNMFHMDYIPLLASLQYCVVRVFGWQDASLIYVPFAAIATAIAALADLIKPKRWGVALAVLLLYGYEVFGFGWYDLRSDGSLCMLFTAAILCLFAREDDSFASLLPTLCVTAVLTGMKIYSGLMLALVLALCLFAQAYKAARARKLEGAAHNRNLWISAMAAIVLVLVMQFSWSGVYHFTTKLASYQAAMANAAFNGVNSTAIPPTFGLDDLFAGNPRTASLLSSISAGNLQNVGMLIAETFTLYVHSKLPYVWLFVLVILDIGNLGEKVGTPAHKRDLACVARRCIALSIGAF